MNRQCAEYIDRLLKAWGYAKQDGTLEGIGWKEGALNSSGAGSRAGSSNGAQIAALYRLRMMDLEEVLVVDTALCQVARQSPVLVAAVTAG